MFESNTGFLAINEVIRTYAFNLFHNTVFSCTYLLLIRILDVKYYLVQLPRGEDKFAFICIFFIYGHAFIPPKFYRFLK